MQTVFNGMKDFTPEYSPPDHSKADHRMQERTQALFTLIRFNKPADKASQSNLSFTF